MTTQQSAAAQRSVSRKLMLPGRLNHLLSKPMTREASKQKLILSKTLAYANPRIEKFAGVKLFDTVTGSVSIDLKATGRIAGKVFDRDGNPVIAGQVIILAKLQNPKYVTGASNHVSKEVLQND